MFDLAEARAGSCYCRCLLRHNMLMCPTFRQACLLLVAWRLNNCTWLSDCWQCACACMRLAHALLCGGNHLSLHGAGRAPVWLRRCSSKFTFLALAQCNHLMRWLLPLPYRSTKR